MTEPKYIEEKLMLLKHDPDPKVRGFMASYLLNFLERNDVRQALEQYYFIDSCDLDQSIMAIWQFFKHSDGSKTLIEYAVNLFQGNDRLLKDRMLTEFSVHPPHPEILAALVTTLKNDSNPEFRSQAARAINEVYWENESAKNELKRALEQDSNGLVRWACWQILWEESDPNDRDRAYLRAKYVEVNNSLKAQAIEKLN